MELDRKRDFGTLYGDDWGRRYVQDDLYYTADGKEWAPTDEQLLAAYRDNQLRMAVRERASAERKVAQAALMLERERRRDPDDPVWGVYACKRAGHGDGYMADDFHLLLPDHGIHLIDEVDDRTAA